MTARRFIEGALQDPGFWRREGDRNMADVVALEQQLQQEYPQLKRLDLCTRSGAVHVNSIEVKPEARGQGIGREVIQRIQNYAAERGVPVTLSPAPERGRKEDLLRFYRDLGFWHNFGRRGDDRYSSPFQPIMIWKPSDRM